MKHTPDLSALTDEQKIAYLAEKVMGWHKVRRDSGRDMWANEDDYGMGYVQNYLNEASRTMDFMWNPLTDWNHWRQVEEKMMEDGILFSAFMESFVINSMPRFSISEYLDADLPTRVDALISAHQSLHGNN
jgi:hypothetical protein